LILPLSRNLCAWPAFISRKREVRRGNEKLLNRLHLSVGGVYSKRRWRLSAASTQAALGLLWNAQVQPDVLQLPPLTKETVDVWFEASWNDLLERGIRREALALARSVVTGSSAVKRANRRGMPKQTTGMKRDDARAEIKRQVRKAFRNLVEPSSTGSGCS